MIDFTNTHFVDETLLTRYHQDLINFLSDTYLDKSGGTMNGQINSCAILPKTDNTYDLGSSSYYWKNAYINNITSGIILPKATGTGLLGISGYPWYSAYIEVAYVNSVLPTIIPGGADTYLGNSSYYWTNAYINNITSGNILPKTTETYDLGSSSYYWNNAYVNNVNSGNILPKTTETYDLGSSSYYWNNAYVKSLTATGITSGSIVPSTTNTYDLGNSTYHWKSLYLDNSIISSDGVTFSSAQSGSRGKLVVTSTSDYSGLVIPSTNNTGQIGHSSYYWKYGYISSVYGQLRHNSDASYFQLSSAAVLSSTRSRSGVNYLWGCASKTSGKWIGIGEYQDILRFCFWHTEPSGSNNSPINQLLIDAYDSNYIRLQAAGGYMRMLNHIYPNASDTYYLGAETLRWAGAWLKNLNGNSITAVTSNTTATNSWSVKNYGMKIGALIINWGVVTRSGSTNYSVVKFAISFSDTNYSLVLAPYNRIIRDAQDSGHKVSNSQARFDINGSNQTINYIAIGI